MPASGPIFRTAIVTVICVMLSLGAMLFDEDIMFWKNKSYIELSNFLYLSLVLFTTFAGLLVLTKGKYVSYFIIASFYVISIFCGFLLNSAYGSVVTYESRCCFKDAVVPDFLFYENSLNGLATCEDESCDIRTYIKMAVPWLCYSLSPVLLTVQLMLIFVYKAAHEKEEEEYKAFAERTNNPVEANLIRENSSVFQSVSTGNLEMISPTVSEEENSVRPAAPIHSRGRSRKADRPRNRGSNETVENQLPGDQDMLVNEYISPNDQFGAAASRMPSSNQHRLHQPTDPVDNDYTGFEYVNEAPQQLERNAPKSSRSKKMSKTKSVSGLRVGKPILRNNQQPSSAQLTTQERNHVSFV